MGMYTALHLALKLPKDTPSEVIEILRFMLGDNDAPLGVPETPDHELFNAARWDYMLRCDSAYFAADTRSALINEGPWYSLTVLSNFKNYEDEISKFVDWIRPYIAKTNPNWIGYRWYEEDEEPTSLYRVEPQKTVLRVTETTETLRVRVRR